jgi:hypothetical protein
MSKIVTNTAYRKQRGTDKPFTVSEEQAKAIWIESVRQDKWRSAKAVPVTAPAGKSKPQG